MATIKLKVDSNFSDASRDLANLGDLTETEAKRIERALKRMKGDEIDSFIQRNQRAAAAVRATDGAMAGLETEQAGLRREIQKLIRAGYDPLDEELNELQKEYAQTSRQIEANTRAHELNEKAVDAAGKALLGIGTAIGAGIGVSIKLASAIEDATAAFTPLVGGVEKAEKLVGMLNETAATTPFQFENISAASKQLLPVMQGDLENTVKTFRMLGDTAGGNAQKLDSITRGYTKAMLKNKVDMEALNMIAEAGVPIYSELADSMGVSVEEMMALSSAGKISSDDLTAAFQKMTSEGGLFFEGMEIASQTASGKLSTMIDVYSLLGAEVGKNFLPLWKDFLDGITDAGRRVTAFVQDGESMRRLLNIILPLIAGVAGGLASFLIITKVIAIVKGFSMAMMTLNAVLAANPVILIAAAIAVVIAAIVLLIRNWDKVVVVIESTTARLQARFEQFGVSMRTSWLRAINSLKIGFLELAGVILEKALGAVNKLLTLAGKIPFVGEKFQGLQENVNAFAAELNIAREEAIETSEAAVQAAKDEQAAARARADATIAAVKEESAARLAALKEQEAANENLSLTQPTVTTGDVSTGAIDPSTLSERLSVLNNLEAQAQKERLATFTDFLDARMEQEGIQGEERIAFLQSELIRVQELENVSREEKVTAEQEVQDRITEIQREASEERKAIRRAEITATADLFSSLSDLVDAYGEDNKAAVIASKALASTSAAINSYLAFTQVLADPTIPSTFARIAMAGSVLASGLAQQKNIWSAETGGSFTVPHSGRVDGTLMKVNQGETVDITPRGGERGKTMVANFIVNEEVIWSIVQKGIDSNEVTFTDENLRAG